MLADFDQHGFALGPDKFTRRALTELAQLFAIVPTDRPGLRVSPDSISGLRAVEPALAAAKTRLGSRARIVRALLFDKRDGANWSLGWHQDRTIEVADRIEVAGFGPFTRKQGRLHVAPPIWLTSRMLTIRLHVDAVDAGNAPLVVAPGSHLMGYVPENTIREVVARCGEVACLAEEGDVWFYSTPILHRSDRSRSGSRRRVLQIDVSADSLPGDLRWACDAERMVEGDASLP